MKKYLKLITDTALFQGFTDEETEAVLHCISAKTVFFEKNEFIFHCGENITHIGLLIMGCAHIIKEDIWGNRNIIAEITSGQLFAEAYACMQKTTIGVSVIAATHTEVLFLDIQKILTPCACSCSFHTKMISNLLSIIAKKNIQLNEKLEYVTKRSTREKLLSYLYAFSQKEGKTEFIIPFNRQQLADYLSVDRSAMSNELCKLRDEGYINFHKNKFTLKR